MHQVFIRKANESYLQLTGNEGVIRELSEVLTFEVPNAKHMRRQAEKKGRKMYSNWDGRIRLLDYRNGAAYLGLHRFVKEYCDQNGYECIYEDEIDTETPFSIYEARKFFESLKLSVDTKPIDVRDYQERAVIHGIQRRRAILLSPTASGKSLIIYLLLRYLQAFELGSPDHEIPGKILIIVPTVGLVEQMYKDFADYSYYDLGWAVEDHCFRIYDGSPDLKANEGSKYTDRQIVITTWQSIFREEQEWFDQFEVAFGDEAHQFDAKSLTNIMASLTRARYRFATTGTLKGSKVNEMVLEGLFGAIHKVTTSRELMDQGTVAELTIKALVLRYSEEDSRLIKGAEFAAERDFIVAHPKRRAFIRNLALSLKGNTLILFKLIDKHGKPLHAAIEERIDLDRKLFYVAGETEAEDREAVRAITEKEDNAIITASYGVFSTGVNIRKIHNIILAEGGKSRVQTLQSIGRGLRKGETKDSVTVYDVVDDLSVKSHKNFALQHFGERLSFYASEQFFYQIYKISLA